MIFARPLPRGDRRALAIAAAEAAHAELLSRLHVLAFGGEEAWSAAWFDELLGQTGVTGWFAQREGAPQGLIVSRGVADEAEILTIGVAPAGRRRGVGAALLEAAEAKAACDGRQVMFLEVSAGNAAARALYAARAYSTAGRRRAYYRTGADALVLRKTLSPTG